MYTTQSVMSVGKRHRLVYKDKAWEIVVEMQRACMLTRKTAGKFLCNFFFLRACVIADMFGADARTMKLCESA